MTIACTLWTFAIIFIWGFISMIPGVGILGNLFYRILTGKSLTEKWWTYLILIIP